MELQKEIQITNTPAVVDVNFDRLQASLGEELKKYEIVVTADTVADAKKLATELNKTRKIIDDRRKEEVAKASEPIKQFDEQMKELVIMCEKGRKDILSQVERFEDETREKCKELLEKARQWLWDKYQVEAKFQRAEFDDLVKISNVTGKGNLTAAVKQRLDARVRDDKDLQDRTARRLLELENQCYKAGLKAPLTQEHVKAFLFDADEVYQRELESLIARELERQEEAEKRIRADMEKEQARKQQEEQQSKAMKEVARQQFEQGPEPRQQPEPVAESKPEPQPEPEPAPRRAAKGNVAVTVTCQFDIEVPAALREDQIEAELRRVMGKAGLAKTLTAVYIKKHGQEAA